MHAAGSLPLSQALRPGAFAKEFNVHLPASLLLTPFFSRSSRAPLICCFTSGATARMMEKDTSPSFSGDSTTEQGH